MRGTARRSCLHDDRMPVPAKQSRVRKRENFCSEGNETIIIQIRRHLSLSLFLPFWNSGFESLSKMYEELDFPFPKDRELNALALATTRLFLAEKRKDKSPRSQSVMSGRSRRSDAAAAASSTGTPVTTDTLKRRVVSPDVRGKRIACSFSRMCSVSRERVAQSAQSPSIQLTHILFGE